MDQDTMRELEARCTQESPPGCTTACPLHVDVRALVAAVQKEDFRAGAEIFSRSVPFPRIISRICDQPCRAHCKRGEAGDPVAIRALEQICVDQAGIPEIKARPATPKDKRVAVVGGGLNGLTVALELAQKGYGVVLFERETYLGGSIRDIPAHSLPQALVDADLLRVITNPRIEVRLNTHVDDATPNAVTLSELERQYDAVYLGLGPRDTPPDVDPLTFQTDHSKVFAGGRMVLGQEVKSPVTSISHGKRAANSIDRLLQGASLTANRKNEGSYSTALFTNIEGVEPLGIVAARDPQEGYTVAEAVQEAKRCLQCECLECVRACTYLEHYGSYPKRYVREIYNNLSIVMGIRRANKMINSCALCGLCGEVCPHGLDMGAVIREARKTMVETGRMPPSAHDFALRDMGFSTSDAFVLHRHQPGFNASAALFFPGCQLSASRPRYVRQAYAFLCDNIPGGVGLSLGCCGAPADWAGRKELFEGIIANIKREWRRLDVSRVITGCPTCYSIFRREMTEIEVETIWTVLDELGLPEGRGPHSSRVLAVHDACTTRHETRLHESVRRVLQKLGHQVVELQYGRDATQCCGYGGLMSFANPELAKEVRQRRVKESDADYLAYCAMCRDNFAREGKRVFHLLDLLFGPDELTGAEKGPGFSRRQENRARLKKTLLKELWGETVPEEENGIELIISEGVQEILEERMILEADLKIVIGEAESTGRKFKNTARNTFIAYSRPVSVTYWVEYSREGDRFRVHNAYSHRLEISN